VCAWLRPAAGPAFLSAKPEGRVLRARLGPHVADFREFAFDKVQMPDAVAGFLRNATKPRDATIALCLHFCALLLGSVYNHASATAKP